MSFITVEDIVKRLSELKALGFVPTMRKGATGIGHTLEQLLELEENNLVVPDFGDVELQTSRANTNNLITLFTNEKDVWVV